MNFSHIIDLVAPCGMNCALCSRYLAQLNGLKRSGCPGCRPRNQSCTYLFGKCDGTPGATAQASFCFECELFPCKPLKRMDKRYRDNYGVSMIENLQFIRDRGLESFLDQQYQTHQCERCCGMISVHNQQCFHCESIDRLVDKQPKE